MINTTTMSSMRVNPRSPVRVLCLAGVLGLALGLSLARAASFHIRVPSESDEMSLKNQPTHGFWDGRTRNDAGLTTIEQRFVWSDLIKLLARPERPLSRRTGPSGQSPNAPCSGRTHLR